MARIDGLDAFNRRLASLPEAAKAEMRTALDESAARLVTLSRSLADVGDGDLRASIETEAGDHALAVRIKAGGAETTRPVREGATAPAVDYARILEFGTPHHPASPFFFPAVRALKRAFRARMHRAYRAAARRVGLG